MSAQAVGNAVGKNHLSLFIPCHRVIGADGSMTGYAGGLENKKKLLELERRVTAAKAQVQVKSSDAPTQCKEKES